MTVLDISTYQGFISASTFASMPGIDRVILKAGGSNSGRYVDSKYVANATAARAASKPLGHYWFNGTGDPATDAQFFVANLQQHQDDDWLILDVESEGSMPHWTPAQVLTFAQTVKALTGKTIGVYMSSSVTTAADWSAVVQFGCWLWVAAYGANNGTPGTAPSVAHWGAYVLWQYTSVGTVPGIAGSVDLSVPGSATPPTATASIPKEAALMFSIVPDASSAQIFVVSQLNGNRALIASPYHLSLLDRVKANDGSDKMLTGELDIVHGYLAAINPPTATATAQVDSAAVAAAVAAALHVPTSFTITGKATS